MYFMKLARLLVFAATAVISTQASAALIATYNFDGGTANNSNGTSLYDLATNGAAPDFSQQAYYSDGDGSNFLSVAGPGGLSDWTISFWINTNQADQGTFKGIFSNNSNTGDYTFQVDSHNGFYRLLSGTNSNDQGTGIIGVATENVWEHIVVQKFSGANASLYFNGSKVKDIGFNPGGLQNFRVGMNRSGGASFQGFVDNISIWNDSSQKLPEVQDLFKAGPGINAVSAPASLLLFGLGCIFAGAIRLRKK